MNHSGCPSPVIADVPSPTSSVPIFNLDYLAGTKSNRYNDLSVTIPLPYPYICMRNTYAHMSSQRSRLERHLVFACKTFGCKMRKI